MTVALDMPPMPTALGSFALIQAGEGLVGSDRRVRAWDGSDYAEYPANGPPRPVRIPRPFLMGCATVTVAAFREVCPDTFQAAPPVFALPASGNVNDRWHVQPFPEVNQQDDHPVVGVSWRDAVTFCERLRRRHGLAARLPTDDEWEYAARAGARSVYGWGDDPRGSLAFAWTKRNSKMKVHPIAQLAPNAWGLHDTAGNVWEWCADTFHGPRGGAIPRRSIRGGAAFNDPTAVRASHRWGQDPDQRNTFLGFRVLIDLASPGRV